MHKLFSPFLLFLFTIFYAEAQQTTHYSFPRIGWSVDVPSSWTVISNDSFNKLKDKGLDTLQNVVDEDINDKMLPSQVINLISVKKDQLNTFVATIQQFDTRKYGFDQSVRLTDSFIYIGLKAMIPNIDTSSENVKIKGNTYRVFHAVLHADNSPDIHEDMYFRLVRGYMFNVLMLYSNAANKRIITGILSNSVFDTKYRIQDSMGNDPDDK